MTKTGSRIFACPLIPGPGDISRTLPLRFPCIAVLLLSLFLLVDSFKTAQAQAITSYTFTASQGVFTPISGGSTATMTGNQDDGYFNNVPIGFTFVYLGNPYTTITPTTNGWAALGTTVSNSFYINEIVSSGTRPLLAPFWDDLLINVSTNFTYITTGNAGERIFTAQWLNMGFYNTTYSSMISFQLKLYEADGRIEFVYRNEPNNPSSITASIGITSSATGSNSFISLNNAGSSPTASTTTGTNNISAKPATGQVYTFTPPLYCSYSANGTVPIAADVTPCINFPSRELTVTSAAAAGSYITMNVVHGLTYNVYTCSTNPSNRMAMVVYREGNPGDGPIAFSSVNTGNTCNSGVNNVFVSFTPAFSGQVRILLNRFTDCAATTPSGLSLRVNVTGGGNLADNQNNAGVDSWIGHIYDGTNSGVSWNQPFQNYLGYYTTSESFDESFGGNTSCFDVYSGGSVRATEYAETYSVRYRMNSTRRGLFAVDLGSDDGSRLVVDGNLVYNNWTDQSFSTRPRVLISLTGSSTLQYDFNENGGANRVIFNNITPIVSNILSTGTSQTICTGNSGTAITGDVPGSLPSGITLQGYQWTYSTTPGGTRTNISGATSATYTPSASTAPFNTPGTYYIYRNVIMRSTNNISPNPYDAVNESNAAVLTVSLSATQPSAITGNSPVCEGSNQTYSVTNVSGVTYNWTFPADWVIVSGNGTNSVQVLAGSQSGNITVTPSTTCGTGPSRTLAVTARPKPAVTTGEDPVICPGTTTAFIYYEITAGNPDGFSIDFDAAANAAGISDISNWSLTGGIITVYVPYSIATGTYNGMLTVFNFTHACPGDPIPVSVIVSDNEPPVIENCPVDFSVYVDGSCNAATVNWEPPTASDNCVLQSFSPNIWPNSYLSAAGSPHTITYTATDLAGNVSYCSFTVNVVVGLAAPVATSAQAIGFNSFTARWGEVAFVQNYLLDVATNSGFTSFVPGFQNRNVGNVTNFQVTGLTGNTTYFYRVRAATSCNTSGNSNTISVTTTPPPNPVEVIASEGLANTDYASLRLAFDNINNGTHRGAVVVMLRGSTVETATAALNASGSGSALYTSVLVYPTASGLSVSAEFSGNPVVNFNGADNVIIDGRVNASGSTTDLVIVNNSTSSSSNTSTIRFINAAENNIIRYCKIYGSTTRGASGLIFFSTASGNGNRNNEISNCVLSSANGNRPLAAIYSSGTTGSGNDNIRILNCNFQDQMSSSGTSYGIFASSNNSNWVISGNSFYETSPLVATATLTFYQIRISAGNGHIIENNFIGGTSPGCEGGAMQITSASYGSRYYGIYLTTGEVEATSVQGNIFRNFSLTSSHSTPFYAVYVSAGAVNIGNITGNILGESSGNGSVSLNSPATSASSYGLYITGAGSVNISNNIIGSIVTTGSASIAHSFYAIYTLGTGNRIVSGNQIGSEVTESSIHTSTSVASGTAQLLRGIWNASTGSITISDNTISNLRNASIFQTSTGQIAGIISTAGVNTITGNSVYNLFTTSPSTGNSITASSVIGIGATSALAGQNISNNKIYNIENQFGASRAVYVIGLYYQNPTAAGSNIIEKNFIHSLYINPLNTSATARMEGLRLNFIASGGNIVQTTISNNIISINNADGINSVICGIFEGGYSSGTSNTRNLFYHNTVYLSGTASGSTLTYAFFNNSSGSSTQRNIRNNLFINERTSASGSGIHHAIRLNNMTGVTLNYNDYYTPGTGGALGRLNATTYNTLSAWRTATSQDANSLNIDPLFQNAGGTSVNNYYAEEITLVGATNTGVLTDYLGTARLIPTLGALERMAIAKTWKGTVSTDFATAANWTNGVVPQPGESIVFDAVPLRHCVLDTDRTLGSITNAQSTYDLVINGRTLTISGDLIFSNGAQIDASQSGSTVVFAGAGQQQIPEGAFVNNQVQNLTINNAAHVVLSGTLNISGAFTATSGRLNTYTNLATLGFNGTNLQPLPASALLNNRVYNLNINNLAGVNLTGNLTIDNTLNLEAGAFSIAGTTFTFRNGNTPVSRNTGTLTTSNTTNLVFGVAGGTLGNPFTLPSGLFTSSPVINNLTINRDNPLTLGNQMMSVRGIVLVTSGVLNTSTNLTLLSDNNQTALIDGAGNGSVSGTVHMQRYLPSGFGYKYVGSPFSNATVEGFAEEIDLSASFPAFYRYDENRESTGWVNYTNTSDALVPMAGYAANSGTSSTPKTLVLSGTVNNGSIAAVNLFNHNKTYTQGFNLMSNPYPSPIDWDAAQGWTRSNIDNAVYYFDAGTTDQYGGTYSTYINGVSSNGVAGRYIASMQGFFVHVSDGTYPVQGSFGMDNRVRVTQLSPAFHKNTIRDQKPLIRISVGRESENSNKDYLVVYFDEAATTAFEPELDAIKLNNTDASVPNAGVISSDGRILSVGAWPETPEELEIPLSVKTVEPGQLVFRLQDIENMWPGTKPYFKDKANGLVQNLLQVPEYRVYLQEGETNHRFSLVFSEKEISSDVFDSRMADAVVENNQIFVNVRFRDEQLNVTLFSLTGQAIFSSNLNGAGIHRLCQAPPPGVYLLQVSTGMGTVSKKILVP